MDKSTLSSYGWIIILTLILTVMLALATPFGDYVGNTVVATVRSYGFVNNQAIDKDSISARSEMYKDKLNAVYPKASFIMCIKNPGCHTGTLFPHHTDECWENTYFTTLTWEQLKSSENGTKYGYSASKITNTYIDEPAFYRCSSLSSIVIPDGVTSIGRYAFFDCTSLTSITIPDTVMSIGYDSFNGCSNLSSIILPKCVTSIGEGAFFECSSLETIIIPSGVTKIWQDTFYECTSLTSITIPNSVTSIGPCAFEYCYSLTDINYQGTKTQWNAIAKASSWNNNTGNYIVHCTDGDIPKS